MNVGRHHKSQTHVGLKIHGFGLIHCSALLPIHFFRVGVFPWNVWIQSFQIGKIGDTRVDRTETQFFSVEWFDVKNVGSTIDPQPRY